MFLMSEKICSILFGLNRVEKELVGIQDAVATRPSAQNKRAGPDAPDPPPALEPMRDRESILF